MEKKTQDDNSFQTKLAISNKVEEIHDLIVNI